MKEHPISRVKNKRGYSTEGSTLLPSVLRPRLFGVGIMVGAVALIGTALNVNNNQVSAAVQATLTIPDNISVDVNPYENNGFAEGTAGQVEVSTNNQAGYTLSIKSKDGTELRNGDNVLNSITTNLTADQYQNGEYYNTWGFKSDVINNEANTSYVPAPSTNGIVLAQANTTSVMPEAFNLAIATKVSQDAVAGNYKNSFVLTAIGNEARYNVTFNVGNGTGGPSGEAPQLSDYIGDDLEVQIPTDTPTSTEGKDFLGWCSKQPREDGSCTGVVVQPGGCFPLCKCDLDLTLYAMYGTKSSSGGGSVVPSGTFSGMSKGTPCEVGGQQGTVYGGRCWMNSDAKTSRTWYQAMGDCPSGWRLPSQADFMLLVDSTVGIGSGPQLYNAGWNDNYWSSTLPDNGGAYHLNVNSSNASVTNVGDYYAGLSATYSVRCVAGQYGVAAAVPASLPTHAPRL